MSSHTWMLVKINVHIPVGGIPAWSVDPQCDERPYASRALRIPQEARSSLLDSSRHAGVDRTPQSPVPL